MTGFLFDSLSRHAEHDEFVDRAIVSGAPLALKREPDGGVKIIGCVLLRAGQAV